MLAGCGCHGSWEFTRGDTCSRIAWSICWTLPCSSHGVLRVAVGVGASIFEAAGRTCSGPDNSTEQGFTDRRRGNPNAAEICARTEPRGVVDPGKLIVALNRRRQSLWLKAGVEMTGSKPWHNLWEATKHDIVHQLQSHNGRVIYGSAQKRGVHVNLDFLSRLCNLCKPPHGLMVWGSYFNSIIQLAPSFLPCLLACWIGVACLALLCLALPCVALFCVSLFCCGLLACLLACFILPFCLLA